MRNFFMTPAGQVVIVAGVGVVAFAALKKIAGQALNQINPVNTDNAVYTGVNSLGESLTGDQDFDLGIWLYDVIHGEHDPND